MKLLSKTNFYFFGVSLVIFCLGGLLFYFLFQIIIEDDIKSKLYQRKEYNLKQMERSDSVVLFQKYSANTVSMKPIDSVQSVKELISDTSIYDAIEGKLIRYRQLSFHAKVRNQNYAVEVRRAFVEQKELIEGVILLEGILFLSFVAILTLINNQVSRNIWRPFYMIVDKISNYKVDLAENMVLPKNNIDEFNELSTAIEKMSAKINHEFNIQKEFIENASHEIQTPLAIVRNKLEILLQSPGLTVDQMDLINSTSVSINRLSKLNEALVILSKIENRQFHEVEDISVTEIIDRHVNSLTELIQIKSIIVNKNYVNGIHIKMHPYLAEILFENLIINSIKHNTSPGVISITTRQDTLELSNPGSGPEGDAQKLFNRFVKSNPKSKSLGLGLSIVKAICDTYMLQVHYRIEKKTHKISILFPHSATSA